MAIIKCKMCGGDLEILEDSSVCECEYCGTRQTVPSADSEKKLTLFNRAGRLLRNCEFDKAAGVFETIVADFPEEAEAYWGLVLCKYGIEYVDDPATGKKIPTCHRSSFDTVEDDTNFEQACENADPVARRLYREEARQIETLRQRILEVSGKEEPYDVFISYKELDTDGERTPDSVIAQEIYRTLTKEGYRVFFSRISLEGKLGVEYEPYIFAALNSAKVMIVVGTDYDYFDAVWVKNEWSRFLKLITSGQPKTIIPVYKDMDPYDMPKELRALAAQNMGKIGAMQDLLHGVEKLLGKDKAPLKQEPQPVIQQVVSGGPTAEALIQRGAMALEESDWDAAKGYFDRILDCDARNANAYLGLYMARKHITTIDALRKTIIAMDSNPASESSVYERAKRFATGDLAEKLDAWETERAEAKRKRDERIAEEKRKQDERIAEENRKREEEERRRNNEVNSVLAVLWRKQDEQAEGKLIALLKEEQNRLQTITQIGEDYDKNLSVKTAAEKKAEELSRQISQMERECNAISLFEGKKKSLLKSRINEYREQAAGIDKMISEADRKLGGYKTRQELDKAKSGISERIKEIETKIRIIKKVDTGLNWQKAMQMFRSVSYVREKVLDMYPVAEFADKQVGDIAEFGEYSYTRTDRKPIEWIVLAKEGNKVLVISRNALDRQQYNTADHAVTWETSSIRKWLNGPFLNEAFSAKEMLMIPEVIVRADKNPSCGTNPGKAVQDQMFLLSITEVNRYLASDEARKCAPTDYAVMQGTNTSSKNMVNGKAACSWWLRSPGRDSDFAATVGYAGNVFNSGSIVNAGNVAVRPAMWIDMGAWIK